jgi:hypothetical protein
MEESATERVSQIVGPEGLALTLASLPSPNARWVARRKAEVVIAVSGGILTMAEACQRYGISTEEFLDWERAYQRGGIRWLRTRCRSHTKSESKDGSR